MGVPKEVVERALLLSGTEYEFADMIAQWQREKDAEICSAEWGGDADTLLYTDACNECAEAIRNQGE